MKLLAVDTALGACSAALLDGGRVLAHAFEPMERGHAERLAPMVQEVMSNAGTGFAALDRLAVTTGPGTFTGQRVGYAFMRGLRIALGRPLVGVTTLAAMAHAARAATGSGAAAVLHDARRGEVYFILVEKNEILVPDRLVSFDDAVGMTAEFQRNGRGGLAVAGTAAGEAMRILREEGCNPTHSQIVAPDAVWVARLAAIAPEPGTIPPPLYLRPPDARLPVASP